VPSYQLQTIPITWPFLTWGLDLVGSFKKAKWGLTYIFVTVDKLTKWIKVKLVASITVAKAMEFIKEIMYRFSVPNNIITNNGTQFTAREFKRLLCRQASRLTMPQCHSQSNS
jgi:transposase InsO family protein